MRQDPTVQSSLTRQRAQSKVQDSKETLVWAGKKSSRTVIQNAEVDQGTFVQLNRSLGGKLGLPAGSYHIYEYGDESLRLGPVVGILTSRDHEKNFPSGKNARLFREMFEACKARGLFLYEFYPEGVNLKLKSVKGYSIDEKGRFYNAQFPVPDVVYNRIRYRVVEQRADVKRILHNYRTDPEIYLFNTRFLNKIEVYRVLRNNPSTCQWIPETALLNSRNLKYFLGKYNSVYLKPIANSRGKGIVKLSKGQGGEYSLHHANSIYSHRKQAISKIYLNLKHAGLRSNNYLVQKAIPLALFRGRVFDLRVQAQKNGEGRWILTGVGVRVAGPNRIVTHIPNGGSAKAYDPVMQEVFGRVPGAKELIDAQLMEITQVVPIELEKMLKLELAILSMDIGVDLNGKLWLIEVNSKPASFDEDFIRSVHTQTLVEYFTFAALNRRLKGAINPWN